MTLSNEPQGGFIRRFEPRATRIPITHRDDIDVEIWVGGSDTAIGDEVEALHLDGAWVVDCAGEIPQHFREAALAVYPRVFADIEVEPSNLDRLHALAREIAASVAAEQADAGPARKPERVFVMCTQGFNRSALVAGLILRDSAPRPTLSSPPSARPAPAPSRTRPSCAC